MGYLGNNRGNFLLDRGITAANYQRADLIVFAKEALKMKLSTNIEFHEDELDLSDRLQIKGKILPDPFSTPETEMSGRLENIPPFGIEDIFNFLTFNSSEYEGLLKGLGHKERAS